MKPKVAVMIVVVVCAAMPLAQAQTGSPALASAIARQAAAALTGGADVNDVALVGTITHIAGSTHESGTVTLKAKGSGESRFDSTLASGALAEIRNNGSSDPQCWAKASASFRTVAVHNCWTDASWFFPAFSSLIANPAVTLTYVGQESRNGVAVQHVRAQRYLSGQKPKATALIARLSTVDYYLDASTYLPVAISFNTHPDSDLNVDIAVEVRYSDYRKTSGITAPFRIRKFINGSLSLDVAVTNVAVNTGLPDSDFVAQ